MKHPLVSTFDDIVKTNLSYICFCVCGEVLMEIWFRW